jgi:hypothetical protein
MHFDAYLIEAFGHPFGVRVRDLADQDLVADGNYLCLHSGSLGNDHSRTKILKSGRKSRRGQNVQKI